MGTQSISVNVLKVGRENTAKSVSQELGERKRDQLKKKLYKKTKRENGAQVHSHAYIVSILSIRWYFIFGKKNLE